MSMDKGGETRESKADKRTKIMEKKEGLYDQIEGVILLNRRDSFSSDCRNIQEALTFEKAGLQK